MRINGHSAYRLDVAEAEPSADRLESPPFNESSLAEPRWRVVTMVGGREKHEGFCRGDNEAEARANATTLYRMVGLQVRRIS